MGKYIIAYSENLVVWAKYLVLSEKLYFGRTLALLKNILGEIFGCTAAARPAEISLLGGPDSKFRRKGGGAVVGRVNREGVLTGYRLAYIYPGKIYKKCYI
jgi:hypothetical protein